MKIFQLTTKYFFMKRCGQPRLESRAQRILGIPCLKQAATKMSGFPLFLSTQLIYEGYLLFHRKSGKLKVSCLGEGTCRCQSTQNFQTSSCLARLTDVLLRKLLTVYLKVFPRFPLQKYANALSCVKFFLRTQQLISDDQSFQFFKL